jgi:hypothetical protein
MCLLPGRQVRPCGTHNLLLHKYTLALPYLPIASIVDCSPGQCTVWPSYCSLLQWVDLLLIIILLMHTLLYLYLSQHLPRRTRRKPRALRFECCPTGKVKLPKKVPVAGVWGGGVSQAAARAPGV